MTATSMSPPEAVQSDQEKLLLERAAQERNRANIRRFSPF